MRNQELSRVDTTVRQLPTHHKGRIGANVKPGKHLRQTVTSINENGRGAGGIGHAPNGHSPQDGHANERHDRIQQEDGLAFGVVNLEGPHRKLVVVAFPLHVAGFSDLGGSFLFQVGFFRRRVVVSHFLGVTDIHGSRMGSWVVFFGRHAVGTQSGCEQ